MDTQDKTKSANTQDTTAQAATIQDNPNVRYVELDTPISRGTAAPITTIALRRPNSGALRGLSLVDIANLNVSALQKLLPRISSPTLTEADCRELQAEDMMALGIEVAYFLTRKADRLDFQ